MSLARAIAALRGGRVVRIGALAVLAVETATAEALDLVDPGERADLLISGARAAALKLGNERAAADPDQPVRIARANWLGQAEAMALVDPAQDLARAPLGPLDPLDPPAEAAAALRLARLAGLLPALWLVGAGGEAMTIDVSEIEQRAGVSIVARARLPIEGIGEAQIVAFRDSASGEEHVALVIGSFAGEPPLVRLHSECLTGDVFGSLKCDCGPQLKQALHLLGEAGGGVLLYLRQEGRGIGLANKLRAYALQDRGLDTVDANRRLGFADDERDYRVAAAILRSLGIEAVRLLTNNPDKVAGLQAEGVAVVERVSHHMPVNPHNADYVATKRERSGHLD